MKLYLIRHGQTEDAAHNHYQNTESVLSAKGIAEAQRVAETLAELKFDRVVCSPLVRTRQTADIINAKLKLSIEISDLLIEEKRPTEVEKQNKASAEATKIMYEIETHYHDPSYRFSDEDTFTLLKTRGLKLISYLESLRDQNVLLVGSGVIFKMLLALVIYKKDLNSYEFTNLCNIFASSNCGISVLEYSLLVGWNVDIWNYTDYSIIEK